MKTRSIMLSALLLTAGFQAHARAQNVAGTFEFKQSVMTAPGATPTDVVAKLVIATKGDSATATWTVPVPGRDVKPMELRGVVKGNTVTLRSGVQQAKMSGQDGDERSLDVWQEFVLSLAGDELSGEVSYHTDNESVEVPSRSVKGRRIS